MINITNEDWIVDLDKMTCRNRVSKIVVSFKKSGNTLIGKLQDAPLKLFKKWAADPQGEDCIKNAVTEAEEVFLREYCNQKKR